MPISLDVGNLTGNIPISLDIGNLVGNIPIDILAQTVGNLSVDLAAQTIGNLNIDIAAQTVGNLNVNIAASSATITVSGSVSISAGSVAISTGVIYVGRNEPIDIGSEAIDRAGVNAATHDTTINKDNPANADGIITTIEIWAHANLTNCKVGIFYLTDGYPAGYHNRFKCRSAATIGSVTAGSKQTFSGLHLEVRVGDYLGMFWDYGSMEMDYPGYAGNWSYPGDMCVVGSEDNYDFEDTTTLSLYGSG
jgi:hypothetical protein